MTSQLSSTNDESIAVFRSLSDIPFITFPTRLDRMLLVVCKTGEIAAEVDLVSRRLGECSVMVLLPGHHIRACRVSDDFDGFFITVAREKLNLTFPTMQYAIPYTIQYTSDPIIKLTVEELESLSLIYDMLRRKLKESRPFTAKVLASLFEVLFFDALGIYSSRSQKTTHKSRREELLMNFIELLEKNFKTERAVSFYADKLFVTPKHLSAVLKEVSGKTAGEWIDDRVVLEAKLMLRTTGMNVQEISTALSFSNQSFFGKYFKHLTGMSPRDFRSKL